VKRLVEQTFTPQSPESGLAELVRATRRLVPEPVERHRIRARVKRASNVRRSLMSRAGLITVLVSGTALAMAGVEHRWNRLGRFERVELLLQPVSHSAPPVTSPAPVSPDPTPAPDARAVPSPIAVDVRGSERAQPADPKRSSEPRRPAVAAVHASPSVDDGDDARLVLEALHELRRHQNVVRASDLLANYLRMHPRGALAQDALALSIEAASIRSDAQAQGAWARRYLSEFPNGRYRALSLEALARIRP
jgi:hypothetical protein